MLRPAFTAAFLFFLATVSLRADEASTFFDDTQVREIRLVFDDAAWYNTLTAAYRGTQADTYFPVRFESGNVVLPRVGIRFRGNSSFNRNGVKKPFKIDFNEFDDQADFFGLKKLNLNNCDLQPSLLTEKLFLDFAGKFVAAMRSVHVRLYINNVYYGLYLALEQPDKTMMQSRYGQDEDGNLYEAGESVQANLSYLGAAAPAYTSRYELKTNETANDYSGLIEFLNILNNTPAAELPAKIEPVCDVENMLASTALSVLFVNMDSYVGTAAEYFLYDRSSDGKFVHVHWDTNEAFGTTGDGTPRLANPFTMDPFYLPTGSPGGGPLGGGAPNNGRPLLEKLWAVDSYKRLYLRLLAKMLREGFDVDSMNTRIQQLAALIRTDVYADTNKAYTNTQFETQLTSQVVSGNLTIAGLTQFVRERYAYLRPVLNNYALPSDIRINEVAFSAGAASPWVELYNPGPGPVTLNSFFLSDDSGNPTKWTLPARTLADGEFLVVWLDSNTAGGDTHANFQLSGTGGNLSLFAAGTVIDQVAYPAMPAGQSHIRLGLWGNQWATTEQPTSAAANVHKTPVTPLAATGQLLVNEVMADNDNAFQDPDEAGAYEDWFEIYNPGDAPVSMAGMYLTDNLSNPKKFKIPDGVTIPAKGHLVFMADNETAQGSRHANFQLSADGEVVAIFGTDGTTLIDSIAFSTQQTDISIGRTNDGSSTWTIFQPASPGALNALPYAPWLTNAASFLVAPAAPASIVSAFGEGFATATVKAETTPLPTSLSGVTVTLVDSANTTHQAPLFFVSPRQINFLMPETIARGRAKATIRSSSGTTLTGDLLVEATAPALFSANATGRGIGLIAAVKVDASGAQTPLPVFAYDAALQTIVATPIGLGASTDRVFLVLYGTGVRGRGGLAEVEVEVGGEKTPVTYAGVQSEYPGLDQINIGPLPRALAGEGSVDIVLTIGNRRANFVTVTIQ